MNLDATIQRNAKAIDAKPVKVKDAFKWVKPLFLSKEDVAALGLIKGFVAVSGTYKRGEQMTDTNLIFASGALSQKAKDDYAQIDIDHHLVKLPDDYKKQYGDAIAKDYPPANTMDAAPVKILTGEKTDTVAWASSFIGSCPQDFVYGMIKDGKFKGCSAVDEARVSPQCNEGSCGTQDPKRDGSHFTGHTLILNSVPNSNGTFVSVVDEADKDMIYTEPKSDAQKQIRDAIMKNPELLKNYQNTILPVLSSDTLDAESAKYMDKDGNWTDGIAGCAKFLVDNKEIEKSKADEIAQYIIDNPKEFSAYQIDFLSGADLVAWWDGRNKLDKSKRDNYKIMDSIRNNMKPSNLPTIKPKPKTDTVKTQGTKTDPMQDIKNTRDGKTDPPATTQNNDKLIAHLDWLTKRLGLVESLPHNKIMVDKYHKLDSVALTPDEAKYVESAQEGSTCHECRWYTGDTEKGWCAIVEVKKEGEDFSQGVMAKAGCDRFETVGGEKPKTEDPENKEGTEGKEEKEGTEGKEEMTQEETEEQDKKTRDAMGENSKKIWDSIKSQLDASNNGKSTFVIDSTDPEKLSEMKGTITKPEADKQLDDQIRHARAAVEKADVEAQGAGPSDKNKMQNVYVEAQDELTRLLDLKKNSTHSA